MFDKKKTVEEYIPNLIESLDYIQNVCSCSSHNLILINVNTPIVTKLIYSQLKLRGLKLCAPKLNDMKAYNSLGGLLRDKINATTEDDILFFDFHCELGQMSDNIVNAINSNRDLFTQAFNSTIILASSKTIYEIRRYASDFWSCINLYVDLTKWFYSPIILPLVKIRTFANATSHLVEFFKKDSETYSRYVDLYNHIENLESYDYALFERIFTQIKNFPDGIGKIELINKFGETLTNIQASKGLSEKRLNDISAFMFNIPESLQYVDMIIMCAEFYYRYGLFDDAISCYQKVALILDNLWADDQKNLVVTFLSCNITICRYIKSCSHTPDKLIDELKGKLIIEQSEYSGETISFIDNYLFLVDCTVQHHSHAQHKDIYNRLRDNSVCVLPMLDFSETLNSCYMWEKFVSSDLALQYINIGNPILTEIYLKIQEMICYFCKGDYFNSRSAYKIAIGLSKNYGHVQIYNIITSFNKNMIFLYENHMKQKFII